MDAPSLQENSQYYELINFYQEMSVVKIVALCINVLISVTFTKKVF